MDTSKRLVSLDAFRGFTIAAMILVNNPGDWGYIFNPLKHAAWHGITPTDLIFPFFLFIVGVSIALAYSKRLETGSDKKHLVKKIIWRSIKIFLVGLLLNFMGTLNFSDLRVVGVLQRIAIVFLVCSILFLYSNWRTQLYTAIVVLVGYFVAMVAIPIPGHEQASLEPGVNLAAYIDAFIVPGKLYQITWDPEGFFSTIPAIGTAIFGMLVGKLILSNQSFDRKVIWLFVIGFTATILGVVWSWFFPINKNLWTSSFVMVSGGLASLTLAASLFLIDGLGHVKFARPGIIFGANAITLYVSAELLHYVFYSINYFGSSLSQKFMSMFTCCDLSMKMGSMLCALIYVSLLFIPAYILYRKRIFIKL